MMHLEKKIAELDHVYACAPEATLEDIEVFLYYALGVIAERKKIAFEAHQAEMKKKEEEEEAAKKEEVEPKVE